MLPCYRSQKIDRKYRIFCEMKMKLEKKTAQVSSAHRSSSLRPYVAQNFAISYFSFLQFLPARVFKVERLQGKSSAADKIRNPLLGVHTNRGAFLFARDFWPSRVFLVSRANQGQSEGELKKRQWT